MNRVMNKQGMKRRDFFIGCGGLVASAALPSFGDDLGAFPERGRKQRLVCTYRHVKIGLEKPFSVLHLSDTHLTAAYEHEEIFKTGKAAERMRLFGGQQETALRYSLEWAKEHTDYVLHTGDLMDWQSEANFDLARKYYGDVSFGCAGNHEFYTYLPDEVHTWQEPFKDRSWPILKEHLPFDARFASKIIQGVNFVMLDNAFGTVMPDQVERFHAEVRKGLPIVLCMHVPIFTDGIAMTFRTFESRDPRTVWSYDFGDPKTYVGDRKRQFSDKTTADFIAYLKGERLLRCILCGHLHYVAQDQFSPTTMEFVCGCNFMFGVQDVLFS